MSTQYKIVSRREFEVNGEKKVAWPEVGFFIDNGDKKYVTLNLNPNILYHVFPIEKPDAKKPATATNEETQY